MSLAAARSENRSPWTAGEHDFYVLLGAEEEPDKQQWTLSRSWKIALRTCIALATLAAMAGVVVLIRQSENSSDVRAGRCLLVLLAIVGAFLWAATLDWCYAPA